MTLGVKPLPHCLRCRIEFTPVHGRQLYCSANCRADRAIQPPACHLAACSKCSTRKPELEYARKSHGVRQVVWRVRCPTCQYSTAYDKCVWDIIAIWNEEGHHARVAGGRQGAYPRTPRKGETYA